MTLPTMVYGAAVALLVAGAAHFLDGGFRSRRWPTRWIWLGALLAGSFAPFFPRLAPARETDALGGVLGLPLESLYDAGSVGAGTHQASQAILPAIDGSLAILWIIGSAAVLLVVAAGCLRLRRLRGRWRDGSFLVLWTWRSAWILRLGSRWFSTFQPPQCLVVLRRA